MLFPFFTTKQNQLTSDNFPLRRSVFFSHGSINKFEDIFVKMIDEIIKIFFMSFTGNTFATYPFNIINLIDGIVRFHVSWKSYIPEFIVI